MEFKKGIVQAWKVMENDAGHGKSWNSTSRSWNFLTEGYHFKNLTIIKFN